MHITSGFYIMLSALLFGSYGVLSRFLSEDFNPFTATWTRSLMIVIILIIPVAYSRSFKMIRRKDIKWLSILLGSASLIFPLNFYGFTHLHVGAATLIMFSSYVITQYVIGVISFKEKITFIKIASLIAGLSGLLLVSITQFSSVQSVSFFAIIALSMSGMMMGIEVAYTKKISHQYSGAYLTLLLYIAICLASVFCDLLFVHAGVVQWSIPNTLASWGIQAIYAGASILAFLLVVKGYKNIEPSVGGLIGLTEIIFGVFFGVLFLGEVVTVPIAIGLLLIIIASGLPYYPELKERLTKTERIE